VRQGGTGSDWSGIGNCFPKILPAHTMDDRSKQLLPDYTHLHLQIQMMPPLMQVLHREQEIAQLQLAIGYLRSRCVTSPASKGRIVAFENATTVVANPTT